MTLYVPDSKTKRWVIISESRIARPTDINKAVRHEVLDTDGSKGCPFCVGNEHLTPPEVYRIGKTGVNESGWQLRVVPNKFPITDIHEVFIHSPSHELDISVLPKEQAILIFSAYRDRYLAHISDGHVIIFCNHGKTAGASLSHPHSQLVVVSGQITVDSLSREPVKHIVESNKGFVSYCPDFSQWPYEVWIASEADCGTFGDSTTNELTIVSEMLQHTIKRLRAVHKKRMEDEQFAYNYYISHGSNWFIRIIPRFIHRAGFELGSGLSVNIKSPAEAASEMRSAM